MKDENFICKLTTWDYIYDLCRDLANKVKDSSFQPEIVVALARGGWFPGRILCDFLGLDDLESLKIEHYVGTAKTKEEPVIRYPVSNEAVEGKSVLIVDDIVDTGKSLKSSIKHVEKESPGELKTSVLQYLPTSEFEPDFIGENLQEWAWIIYPWNFMEDMIELLGKCLTDEPKTKLELRMDLKDRFSLDPVWFEVAQPNRLEEVLVEMEKKGLAQRVGEGWLKKEI